MGMTTAMKIGMTVIMVMIVPAKLARVLSQDCRLPGRVLSQTSTSLPNLLTILPIGVVSKKDMGLIITLVSIFLWSSLEALRVVKARMPE